MKRFVIVAAAVCVASLAFAMYGVSTTKPPAFAPAVATVADTNSSSQLPVSIRLNPGIRGVVVTKSSGGRLTTPTNADAGFVGYRKESARP